jgi:hypothetical protein
MHSPAANLGRNTTPSLKMIFAVMAGFLMVFVILAELASATTNDQPAVAQVSNQTIAPAPAAAETSGPVANVEPASDAVRPNSLSYGANEVIKMYKSGVKTDTLLTYIETSNLSYLLSSREIVYLSQSGVPSEIVNAMIRRDHQVELAKANARQQTEIASGMPEPATTPVTSSQPSTTVVVQPAPKVKYVTPVYAAPTYTAPVVVNPSPNVTIIGSRYGSSFYNGCYSGPFSGCYNYFNNCWPSPSYGYGYHNRLAYGGFYGGFGHFGHHRSGRF